MGLGNPLDLIMRAYQKFYQTIARIRLRGFHRFKLYLSGCHWLYLPILASCNSIKFSSQAIVLIFTPPKFHYNLN